MKNLRLLSIFAFTLFMMSCDTDDDSNNANPTPISGDPGITVTLDGGAFSNFVFEDQLYGVTLLNSAIQISAGDEEGNQITLFLNSTGGYGAGSVKTMGNIDSGNAVTYANIRTAGSPQISYFANSSGSGNITITENITHPTDPSLRLISGTIDVTATSTTNSDTTTMTGTFKELEYPN